MTDPARKRRTDPSPGKSSERERELGERATDPAVKLTLRTGYWLLAVSLPFGLTLEALHGFKVRAFLQSEMRRELFRLAHAHGTMLGILCLVFAVLAERHIAKAARLPIARLTALGAVLMPLGFFLGGILNSEGDPSLGIALVPVGAIVLIAALVRAAQGTAKS